MTTAFESIEPRRGDVWYASVSLGAEQPSKYRPVVVLSNDKCNEHSHHITVVPLSTRIDRPLPTHVIVPPTPSNGLCAVSVVKAESLTALSKDDLSNKVGSLPEHILRAVEEAVKIQLDLCEDVI